jgi:membrane-associated phospholipid phosphatase
MLTHRTPSVARLVEIILDNVQSYDLYSLVFMVSCCGLALVYYPYVAVASAVVMLDIFIASAIGAIIILHATSDIAMFSMVRRFYIIPLIYLMYDQVHRFVAVVHPVDYDHLFIEADRWIFGTDPTVWMAQFSHPVLTEYFQLTYFLFYVLPIMQAIELWRNGDLDKLDVFGRAMTFCYFISYAAYFAMPAVGPRFTLHDFSLLNEELPGLFLTKGVTDPVAVVNRDCMPSGHTMLTLVNIIIGFRFHSRYRWLFLFVGGSLIISTVYLRYHYAIDVIVGALMAVIFLQLEPAVNRWIRKRTQMLAGLWKISHVKQ